MNDKKIKVGYTDADGWKTLEIDSDATIFDLMFHPSLPEALRLWIADIFLKHIYGEGDAMPAILINSDVFYGQYRNRKETLFTKLVDFDTEKTNEINITEFSVFI